MPRRNEVVIRVWTEDGKLEYQRAIFISAAALKRRGRPRSDAEKARAKVRNAEWREANPGRQMAYHQDYYEENKEQILKKRSLYYQANKEDIKAGQRMNYRRKRKDPNWRRYRSNISRGYRKRRRTGSNEASERDKNAQKMYVEMRRQWARQDKSSNRELTAPTRRGILTIVVAEEEDSHDTW